MPLRLAILGIDHPHGAHWRQQFANFSSDLEIVAFVPSFGGGSSSLEERFAQVPRFDSVQGLLANADFDAAFVGLSNRDGPPAMAELARAGKHILAEKPVAAITAAMWPAGGRTTTCSTPPPAAAVFSVGSPATCSTRCFISRVRPLSA
jgi:predicted dehydrogenase